MPRGQEVLSQEEVNDSCVLQVGNLFGKHRSTIITLYNGAFDSSSAVFLVIKVRNTSEQHLSPASVWQALVL